MCIRPALAYFTPQRHRRLQDYLLLSVAALDTILRELYRPRPAIGRGRSFTVCWSGAPSLRDHRRGRRRSALTKYVYSSGPSARATVRTYDRSTVCQARSWPRRVCRLFPVPAENWAHLLKLHKALELSLLCGRVALCPPVINRRGRSCPVAQCYRSVQAFRFNRAHLSPHSAETTGPVRPQHPLFRPDVGPRVGDDHARMRAAVQSGTPRAL